MWQLIVIATLFVIAFLIVMYVDHKELQKLSKGDVLELKGATLNKKRNGIIDVVSAELKGGSFVYGEKRNLETMLNIIENSHQIELFIDMSYSKLEKIRLEKLQWSPCQPGQSNLSSKQGMFTSIAHMERIEKERERVEKELVKYEEDLKEMDEFLERIARKKHIAISFINTVTE